MHGHRPSIVILSLACGLALPGCLPSQQAPVQGNFRAEDTPSKVPAIVGAADSEEQAELAELVHALADKDPAVRLFAIHSLKARTGETRGYDYYQSAEQRQPAINRWHDWLDEQNIPKVVVPPAEDEASTQDDSAPEDNTD